MNLYKMEIPPERRIMSLGPFSTWTVSEEVFDIIRITIENLEMEVARLRAELMKARGEIDEPL